jgi:hypothetical protein
MRPKPLIPILIDMMLVLISIESLYQASCCEHPIQTDRCRSCFPAGGAEKIICRHAAHPSIERHEKILLLVALYHTLRPHTLLLLSAKGLRQCTDVFHVTQNEKKIATTHMNSYVETFASGETSSESSQMKDTRAYVAQGL